MRCQNCGRELGDGLLPARCPHCGSSPVKKDAKAAHQKKDNLSQLVNNTRIAKMKHADKKQVARTSQAAQSSQKRAKFFIFAIVGVAVLFALIAFISFLASVPRVPDVVGWQEERAQTELKASGYEVEKEEAVSQTVDAGKVISTDPPALTTLPKGQKVVMSVALPRIMPEVVGKLKDVACSACDSASIPYKIEEEASDQPEGTILRSSIEAGQTVSANTTAILTAAIPLRVPHVVGLTQAEAESVLKGLSLAPQITYQYTDDINQQGKVLSSDPVEGTTVAVNSPVTLVVASTTQGQAQQTADAVIDAIYGSTPSGDSIGAILLSFLSPASGYVGASPHEVWWGLVKRGGQHLDVNPALQSLPRSIVSKNITVAPDGKSATAQVAVRWSWDPLGPRYSGVTSQDTHNITMTFDDQGKLLTFNDPQTDIPNFTYG